MLHKTRWSWLNIYVYKTNLFLKKIERKAAKFQRKVSDSAYEVDALNLEDDALTKAVFCENLEPFIMHRERKKRKRNFDCIVLRQHGQLIVFAQTSSADPSGRSILDTVESIFPLVSKTYLPFTKMTCISRRVNLCLKVGRMKG